MKKSIKKKVAKTEWVLVDTISTFRIRYLVEVPKGKKEYALDTVVMHEAKEFSQAHLDETIVSSRVVDQKEALQIFDEDNSYLEEWSDEQKKQAGFTPIK